MIKVTTKRTPKSSAVKGQCDPKRVTKKALKTLRYEEGLKK